MTYTRKPAFRIFFVPVQSLHSQNQEEAVLMFLFSLETFLCLFLSDFHHPYVSFLQLMAALVNAIGIMYSSLKIHNSSWLRRQPDLIGGGTLLTFPRAEKRRRNPKWQRMWVAITRGVADASERIIAGRERRSGRAVFLVGKGSISDVTDTIFRFGISQNIQTRYYSNSWKPQCSIQADVVGNIDKEKYSICNPQEKRCNLVQELLSVKDENNHI